MGRKLVLIFMGSFCALGCQRDMSGGRSTLSIQVPAAANTLNKSGGVGAMATMPAGRKACYGVVVSGGGLNDHSATCGPKGSVFAGFVEPGGTVSVSLDKGKGRTVELFAFLENAGQDVPCPQLGPNLPAAQILNTFKVGSVSNVDMTAEVTEITITASFPGLSNTIAQELALPTSCSSSSTAGAGPPGFSISSGRSAATGTGYTLLGGFGKPVNGQVATGTGFKLFSR